MDAIFRRLFIFLSFALTTPGSAHILFAKPTAVAGSYYIGFLRVGHGCDGSPTRSIHVEIPASIVIARPQPKAGWAIDIEHEQLATPIMIEGKRVTDRVSAIRWSGTLAPDEFDQFGLLIKAPANPGALYFPTTQRCDEGVNEWTGSPTNHAHRSKPAPKLLVTSAQNEGHRP